MDPLPRWWWESVPLRWRHNERDSVSNHQPQVCLLYGLFTRRSMKTWKLRVTGLLAGNSPGTGEFPAQMASNAENVSIWWRHHALGYSWEAQGGHRHHDCGRCSGAKCERPSATTTVTTAKMAILFSHGYSGRPRPTHSGKNLANAQCNKKKSQFIRTMSTTKVSSFVFD